jgi:hypothetical protein
MTLLQFDGWTIRYDCRIGRLTVPIAAGIINAWLTFKSGYHPASKGSSHAVVRPAVDRVPVAI